ncbi:glycosyltransferase [Meiothermus sp. CFH 77666]|uniref:glycosyltransferase n=1 Tax=Meiothermus sp. CFH 77666 TaxID=2817942 RepID=UPI001AA032EF|nr:glycosyltransferase [Meiothermus sp. CFH 77666]MBO1436371.1 glycosyltransferase [Meiothermus sp. CFH 77666]
MSSPLVSVLIPIFNHAQYISRCLDSLLEDGWDNIEALVVDDGSSDNSFEIAQEWADRHSTKLTRFELTRQQNQGLPRTLNRLLERAKGEYIALLASDDYLLQGGIAARVKALEANPGWLAVIGDTYIVDPANNLLDTSGAISFAKRQAWVFDHPKTLRRELLVRWWSPGPSVMLRKGTFHPDQVGLYDESLSFEDRDYYLRLISRDGLGFVNYPVAAYRIDPARLSAPPPEHILRDEVLSERKNASNFGLIERFMLSIRSHRTKVKLMLRREPNSLPNKLRMAGVNVFWALIRLYHLLYLHVVHMFQSQSKSFSYE